jgi:cell fate regulator YaaT (PSP1 superfamily)
MDKKNGQNQRGNAPREENNGQRISVRPGNFTPPGAPVAQNNAQDAGQGGNHQGGGGRHRGRRGGRGRHGADKARQAQNGAPVSENRQNNQPQKPKEAPQGKPAQNQNQPRQGNQNAQNAQNAQGGGKNRRNRNRRGNRERAEVQKEAPVISESLRRELDEEFATPTLGATSSLLGERKKEVEELLDSEEFAVDIASASYLLDDVPCGFPIPDGTNAVEVVGVRFRSAGRLYFFSPNGMKLKIGTRVIVDTARGPELGDVVMLNRRIAEKYVVQPLRAVMHIATKEDIAHEAENRKKEADALKVCAQKIAYHKLDMRLVDAQYTFDNSKLLFYFTSEGRVDFRELVRDLAGHFHTRIELRQIGIRDEARLIGGLGMCGRPFCCATHLSDFGQVSVKMAKEQGLSINASKISGCCGRLMCCLRYEQESYQMETMLTPKKDALVETPDGKGTVVESTPLTGMVKVKLNGADEEPAKTYHRDLLVVIPRCPRTAEKAKPVQNEAPEDAVADEDKTEE